MPVPAYGPRIARIYDLLVEGREDAEARGEELEFLLWALREQADREVQEVLDAGCGTGKHLIPLLREGMAVTGLDNSPAMVEVCRQKLSRRDLRAELRVGRLEDVIFEERFDAALCMNSVICYLVERSAMRAALAGLRRALRPGGLLVLDNCNFLSQWPTFGETYRQVRAGRERWIEFEETRTYEDFASHLHIRVEASVEGQGESYEFVNEDLLRVMTAGELAAELELARFAGATAHPSFELSRREDACGERIILLARRPD